MQISGKHGKKVVKIGKSFYFPVPKNFIDNRFINIKRYYDIFIVERDPKEQMKMIGNNDKNNF